jgi:hypothetical protein
MVEKDFHISEKYNFRHGLRSFYRKRLIFRFNLDQMRDDINKEKLNAYCSLIDAHALSERVNFFKNYLYRAESV